MARRGRVASDVDREVRARLAREGFLSGGRIKDCATAMEEGCGSHVRLRPWSHVDTRRSLSPLHL